MDAIIGRYRARTEETGLQLKHSSGISFELTAEEMLGLLEFIHAYKQVFVAQHTDEPQTEPRLQKIVIKRDDQH